jgi:outer membrane receptor protein involved in Fe transport
MSYHLQPARLRLAVLGALAFFTSHTAGAQTAPVESSPAPAGQTMSTVVISADASAAGLPKAYSGGQTARGGRVGMFGNMDNLDTPFNSTNFTQQFIEDQQAHSVADVLQSDPGVRVARGFGNYQELYVIRGFPLASDDLAYNGLYSVLPRQYIAAELLERVEVFRGANSFLNGAAPGGSGIGGSVNLLPKRAPNAPLTQLTVGEQTGSQSYFAADIARRFGPDNRSGVRINAVHRKGGTGIDDEDRALDMAVIGLDYRGACRQTWDGRTRACATAARPSTSPPPSPSRRRPTPPPTSASPGIFPASATSSAPCAANGISRPTCWPGPPSAGGAARNRTAWPARSMSLPPRARRISAASTTRARTASPPERSACAAACERGPSATS